MKKANNIKCVAVLDCGTGFYVDVMQNGETLEAWIYNVECGIKQLMFGVDCDYDTFESMIEAELNDYIISYREEVMSE